MCLLLSNLLHLYINHAVLADHIALHVLSLSIALTQYGLSFLYCLSMCFHPLNYFTSLLFTFVCCLSMSLLCLSPVAIFVTFTPSHCLLFAVHHAPHTFAPSHCLWLATPFDLWCLMHRIRPLLFCFHWSQGCLSDCHPPIPTPSNPPHPPTPPYPTRSPHPPQATQTQASTTAAKPTIGAAKTPSAPPAISDSKTTATIFCCTFSRCVKLDNKTLENNKRREASSKPLLQQKYFAVVLQRICNRFCCTDITFLLHSVLHPEQATLKHYIHYNKQH